MWRDFWFSQLGWERELLAPSGWRPGMLLNSLQHKGQPPTTKNYLGEMVLVPRLKKVD